MTPSMILNKMEKFPSFTFNELPIISSFSGKSYYEDILDILEMLNFAYGISTWEFKTALLQKYVRGTEPMEISTSGYDLIGYGGSLEGDPEDIEAVFLSALGC